MKRINIKALGATILSTAVGVLSSSNTFAADAWGPARPTTVYPNAADHITFNSIVDNPEIGDERNFVRVKEYGTAGPHLDSVTLEVGKEYEVYIYYHNNASSALNSIPDDQGEMRGIAKNVRVSTSVPTKLQAGESGMVKATISSTNASPSAVWDTAYLNADETVYLRYVANSAVIHNAGTSNGSVLDPDALFSDGAFLAYNKERADGAGSAWGFVPGCNEYAGYVTYRLAVDKPGFYFEKNVAAEDGQEYDDVIVAAPGETLKFKLNYSNIGTTAQSNVTIRDELPVGLTYVDNTAFGHTTANPDDMALNVNALFGDGLNIGTFQGGEVAELTYKAKLSDNIELFPCGDTEIYNDAYAATMNGTEYDRTKIIVRRKCTTTPPELPKTGMTDKVILAIVSGSVIAIAGLYICKAKSKSVR